MSAIGSLLRALGYEDGAAVMKEWNRNPEYGYRDTIRNLRTGTPPDPEIVAQYEADEDFMDKYGVWPGKGIKNKEAGFRQQSRRRIVEAMATYDAEEMLGKKKPKKKDREKIRAIIRAALADKPGSFGTREQFLKGLEPGVGEDFGFSGEIARERGLGYGQPRSATDPRENLRTLVSALEEQQGVTSSSLPSAGAEVMEDPELVASAEAVPRGAPAPGGPVDIQALLNEASGVGRAATLEDVAKLVETRKESEPFKRSFMQRLLNTDRGEIREFMADWLNEEARRKAAGEEPQPLTGKAITYFGAARQGGGGEAANYLAKESRGTTNPELRKLLEQEKLKDLREQRLESEYERIENQGLENWKAYQGSNVQKRLLDGGLDPEVERRLGMSMRSHGGEMEELIDNFHQYLRAGHDPESALDKVDSDARRAKIRRIARFAGSRGIKFDPLTYE